MSELLETIFETMVAAHEAGVIDDETILEFYELCFGTEEDE